MQIKSVSSRLIACNGTEFMLYSAHAPSGHVHYLRSDMRDPQTLGIPPDAEDDTLIAVFDSEAELTERRMTLSTYKWLWQEVDRLRTPAQEVADATRAYWKRVTEEGAIRNAQRAAQRLVERRAKLGAKIIRLEAELSATRIELGAIS